MTFKLPHIRGTYFGIGPVLVAGLLALALTKILWPLLTRMHERYPDPVAGQITWSDVDKSADMHALLLLVGSTALFSFGITALARTTVPVGSVVELETVNQFLLFSLAPAGYCLAANCMSNEKVIPPFRFISAFPLGAVLILLMLRRYRNHVTKSDFFTIGGAVLLTPVMAGFGGMAITLAMCRLFRASVTKIVPYVSPVASAAIGAAVLALIIIWVFSPTIDVLRHRILRCLMATQYAIPLLLFYLVPPPLVDATKQFRNPYPRLLVVTLTVLVLLSIYRMYRRFYSATIEIDRPLIKAMSPASVVALMVFVICGSAQLPTISNDFFHFGETMVPWQQIWHFHSVPYVDFAPVHGLMEILNGALNQMFFDGTAANDSGGEMLLSALGVAVTAITACELLSPLAALFLLFAFLPGLDRLYFVTGPLFLIASTRILRNPVIWLAVWIVVGLFASAYNQAMGPALVIGTAPIALWQTWRGFRLARWPLATLIGVLAIVGGLIFIIRPVKQVAAGFLNFILDNSWTNEAANGVGWAQGIWMRDRIWGTGSSQLLWELVRSGWVPAGIGFAVVCWKQFSKPAAERNLSAIVLCASIPPTLLVSSLWIIERLDAGFSGRPGALTLVTMFYLVPAAVFLTISKTRPGLTVLITATFVGLLCPWAPTQIDPDFLLKKPGAFRYIGADTSVVDGRAIGLPCIGQAIRPSPDWTINLLHLKKDLKKLLKPGETYFDLANTTGLYFYLNMRAEGQYAPYVATNARLQAVMMRQVQEHSSPVVLVAPSNPFDEVPMSIRCYRPYHDFVLKYTVLDQDGYTFLVDPARNPQALPLGTELQLQRLDQIFKKDDLLRLPIAWGDSFGSMRNRFTSVARLPETRSFVSAAGKTPMLTWPIPIEASSGKLADFIRLRFTFDATDKAAYRRDRQTIPPQRAGAEPQLSLTWETADGKTSAAILFRGDPGDLLVPLGSYPRWLLDDGFRTMTLWLQNPACARRITVSDVEFLRLKPL